MFYFTFTFLQQNAFPMAFIKQKICQNFKQTSVLSSYWNNRFFKTHSHPILKSPIANIKHIVQSKRKKD